MCFSPCNRNDNNKKRSLEGKSTKNRSYFRCLMQSIEIGIFSHDQCAPMSITRKMIVGRLNQQRSSRRRRRWWWCTGINNSCRFDTLSIDHSNAWLSKIGKDVWGILKRQWAREDKLSPSQHTWTISFSDLQRNASSHMRQSIKTKKRQPMRLYI